MTRRLNPDLRWKVLARADEKCERCGNPLQPATTHVHHLTYARVGKERLTDLQAICINCHGIYHPFHHFVSIPEQRRRAKTRRNKQRGNKKRAAWIRKELQNCAYCGGIYGFKKHRRVCRKMLKKYPPPR